MRIVVKRNFWQSTKTDFDELNQETLVLLVSEQKSCVGGTRFKPLRLANFSVRNDEKSDFEDLRLLAKHRFPSQNAESAKPQLKCFRLSCSVKKSKLGSISFRVSAFRMRW